MNESIIRLGEPTFGDSEIQAVASTFGSGWIAGNGPKSRAFEKEFSRQVAAAQTIAVSSCTAALHLTFKGLGLGPGDDVLVADYTFPATGHAVAMCGARPRFVDVRPDTWTIDVQAIGDAMTPQTVGIVAVDVFGQAADYLELEELAARHGIWLVEDAAAGAGATYRSRPVGSFGDAACFSFHGRKGITCGEGGAITTRHSAVAAYARKMHAFGIESALSRAESDDLIVPQFDEIGWNYKLSDIAAAVMLVQLERLPELISARQRVANGYAERLSGVPGLSLPAVGPDRTHVWQSYVLTLDPMVDRARLARHLRTNGVQCNIGTYASHLQPAYGSSACCPVSENLFSRHLAIPMHANLTSDEIDRVAAALTTGLKSKETFAVR